MIIAGIVTGTLKAIFVTGLIFGALLILILLAVGRGRRP